MNFKVQEERPRDLVSGKKKKNLEENMYSCDQWVGQEILNIKAREGTACSHTECIKFAYEC